MVDTPKEDAEPALTEADRGLSATIELLGLFGLRGVAEKSSKKTLSKRFKGKDNKTTLAPPPANVVLYFQQVGHNSASASAHLPSLPMRKNGKDADGNPFWSCVWPKESEALDDKATPIEWTNLFKNRATSSIHLRREAPQAGNHSLAQDVPALVSLNLGLVFPGENAVKSLGMATVIIPSEDQEVNLDIPVTPANLGPEPAKQKLSRFGMMSKKTLLAKDQVYSVTSSTVLSIKLKVQKDPEVVPTPAQEDFAPVSHHVITPPGSPSSCYKADSSTKTVQTDDVTSCSTASGGEHASKSDQDDVSKPPEQDSHSQLLANIVISYHEEVSAHSARQGQNEESREDNEVNSFLTPLPKGPSKLVSTPLARVLVTPDKAETTPCQLSVSVHTELADNTNENAENNASSVLFKVEDGSVEVSIEGNGKSKISSEVKEKGKNSARTPGSVPDYTKSFEGNIIELSHTESNIGDLTVDTATQETFSVTSRSYTSQSFKEVARNKRHPQRKFAFDIIQRMSCAGVVEEVADKLDEAVDLFNEVIEVDYVVGRINDIIDEADERLCDGDNFYTDDESFISSDGRSLNTMDEAMKRRSSRLLYPSPSEASF